MSYVVCYLLTQHRFHLLLLHLLGLIRLVKHLNRSLHNLTGTIDMETFIGAHAWHIFLRLQVRLLSNLLLFIFYW